VMGGCVTEEQAIARAQSLDLVYSQSGKLYEMLPDDLTQSLDLTASKSLDTPPVDGVIGFCLRLPQNLLRRRNLSRTLFPIIPPNIHPDLVKILRYMF
ncbi:hypothetical protein, partial [Actinobacillus pleuropneumoniae]|uniref:hypothetical protein n=1 Tax=Actinobacillus pleuropneumoniae TaxID=715 RepID=UPI00227BC58E